MPRKVRATGPARGLTLRGRVSIQAAAGEGQGRRFSMVAYSGERFRQPWSDCPLVIDLDTLRLPSQPLPVLYDHMDVAEWVAGRADTLAVESGQLVAAGPVYESTRGGQMVLMLGAEGHTWQASVGADIGRREKVSAGATVVVNGVEHAGPVEVARDVELREISFVVIGAAKNTAALVMRRLKGGAMDFETWVTSKGFDPNALDEIQRANMQQMYDAEFAEEEGAEGEAEEEGAAPPAPAAAAEGEEDVEAAEGDEEEEEMTAASRRRQLQARRAADAAEVRRVHAITALCATAGNPSVRVNRQDVPLAARAIEQGWTRDRTELELLRLRRPGQVDVVRGHDRDCTLQALQGAMLLRAGGRLDHPSYTTHRAVAIGLPRWLRLSVNADQRQRVMEAAHDYSDMSAVDVCREALRLAGREAPRGRKALIQAAFSGGDLTNIFTTSVNARLLEAYAEAPDTTGGWVQERDVNDFKENEDIRLKKGGNLTRHARGQTAQHMHRKDTKETYKVGRYSGQIVIDEMDIIDDRLNAFATLPKEMGEAAARLRPDLVYSLLKANGALASGTALFHSNHSNTDNPAVLSIATIQTGVTRIRRQQEEGVNLNLQPTHLIVPSTLDFAARELVQSTVLLIAGATDTVRGNVNTVAGIGLTPVSEPRLDNGVTDPATGTAYDGDTNDWFLAAAAAHGIVVAYLAGTGRSPQSRSWVLDRGGQWGMGWDINMDVGADVLDYKGLYRGGNN